jgi:hypothetical protein
MVAVGFSYMIIDVDDIASVRFEVGLSYLREGGGLRFNRVEFVIDNHTLHCRIITQWQIDSLTEATARAELGHANAVFHQLQTDSSEFGQLARRHTVRYSIVSDYGSGAVEVCRLDGDTIAWTGR